MLRYSKIMFFLCEVDVRFMWGAQKWPVTRSNGRLSVFPNLETLGVMSSNYWINFTSHLFRPPAQNGYVRIMWGLCESPTNPESKLWEPPANDFELGNVGGMSRNPWINFMSRQYRNPAQIMVMWGWCEVYVSWTKWSKATSSRLLSMASNSETMRMMSRNFSINQSEYCIPVQNVYVRLMWGSCEINDNPDWSRGSRKLPPLINFPPQ